MALGHWQVTPASLPASEVGLSWLPTCGADCGNHMRSITIEKHLGNLTVVCRGETVGGQAEVP